MPVMLTNFWSFVYDIIKGSWAKVSSDISSSIEMTGLQSWSIDFFLFLCSEIEEKTTASIWRPVISRLVEISLSTLAQ